ncbi:MAG TPA: hypothetical protein VHB27_13285, partial [Rhodopila sp.]|uniref:hypothetical protein n=1 Tax=Rhodopila sp. TaxID=2480087 RepID=UPI002CFEDD4A
MLRLIALLLFSFALVFGSPAAQARPDHPMPAAMHSGDCRTPMPMDGCIHGKRGCPGAPCPMMLCFSSAPFFLAPTNFGVPLPVAHDSIVCDTPGNAPIAGTISDTDPPVPRFVSM